jgi:hypothetical protein
MKLLNIYKDCALQASRGLWRNPTIIAGSLAAFVLFWFASSLFAPLGFGGGMLLGLLQVGLIALYFSWIASTVDKDRLRFKDLWALDYSMFFTVMSVAFVLWIVQLLFSAFSTGADTAWIMQMLSLGLVIIFNCVPEVIYLNRVESVPALTEAAKFTQENWIEWFLPLLLILSPWLLHNPVSVLTALGNSETLLPSLTIIVGALNVVPSQTLYGQIAVVVVAVTLANWYMLFRAHLFKALESGKHRRR